MGAPSTLPIYDGTTSDPTLGQQPGTQDLENQAAANREMYIRLLLNAQQNTGQQPQGDPTQDLESRVTPSADTLGQALQNAQNAPQPQLQPPANNAQNAGPVKLGLRGVFSNILQKMGQNASNAMIAYSTGETYAQKSERLAQA